VGIGETLPRWILERLGEGWLEEFLLAPGSKRVRKDRLCKKLDIVGVDAITKVA
jgi:hypothetical protein